jgi:uncharacterized repeat protein (TIGR01451 family)
MPGTARAVDLGLAIAASPDPVEPGEMMTISLTVTNQSESTSDAVRLELAFPSEFSDLADNALSDGGDCTDVSGVATFCDGGEIAFWNLGNLPPGRGRTVTLPPSVLSSVVPPAVISLDSEVFENGMTRGTANLTVAVESMRRLEMSVDADREPVTPGEELTYHLAYGNRSDTATTNTTLTFPLPAGTTFVAASDEGVSNGSEVIWDLGLLQSHVGGQASVTVLVESGMVADGDLVEVDRALLEGEADFVTHEARATAITRVESGAPMAFSVAVNPDPVEPGETLLTELTVTNDSGSLLSNVQVQLLYPTQLLDLADAALSDNGDCTNVSGVGTFCDAGEIVLWDVGTLPPGGGQTVFLPPEVGTLPGGELVRFTARAIATGQPSSRAFHTVVVEAARRLDLSADADHEPVAPGQELTYHLTYGNRSDTSTTNTTLTFPLPAGTSFVAASDGGVSNGSEVVWNIGSFQSHTGGQASVTVLVESGMVADGDLLEVAPALLEGEADFVTHEARATAITRVESGAPMAFSIAVNPDPVEPQETLLTELTVTNDSGSLLSNVQVQLLYPTQLLDLADAALSDNGDCTNVSGIATFCDAGEIVLWDVGTLPPGGGQTVFLPPKVGSPPGGELVRFTARVIASGQPSSRAFHTVVVEPARRLELSVDADREPVAPGEELTYGLAYGNRSDTTTTNTTLTFPLPAGTTFVAASGGGVVNGSEVEWDIGTLEFHQGDRESVTVLVDSAMLSDGDLLEVSEALFQGEADFQTHEARATSTTRVQSDAPLSLSLTASPDPVRPGNTLLTELTVTNETTGSLLDVRIELLYPPQLFSLEDVFISDGGDCTNLTGVNSRCDPGETVFWNLGTLPAGFDQTVSLPPIVRTDDGAPPDGSVIRYRSEALSASFGKSVDTWAVLVVPPPFDLLISDETLSATELYEACNSITLRNVLIAATARLTLQAPKVIVDSVTEARLGALVTVITELPEACPGG